MSVHEIMEHGRSGPILEVAHLSKFFYSRGALSSKAGAVRAVDDVSFSLNRGETLGLVGESGCGKSTTGRTVIRLLEKTSGTVTFDGIDLYDRMDRAKRQELRRKMQIIFQDPYASLNPRMTIGEILGEALSFHRLAQGVEKRRRQEDLLGLVGIPARCLAQFPHEFSGGQRQRIGIARALSVEPEFIVCDEPVSALDVSIQGQVINLMKDLQATLGLTYLFIGHDLSVVKHVSDRVAVMYVGKIVESADVEALYEEPLHPYTQALFSAIPIADPKTRRKRIILEGDIPSPKNPPPGCRFHTRCRHKMDICSREEPPLRAVRAGHTVACHLYNDVTIVVEEV